MFFDENWYLYYKPLPKKIILLFQLTYSSYATRALNSSELNSMVSASRRNNAERGLTGILYYNNGIFIQNFEGERLAVNSLYQHLVKDERHRQVKIVSSYEIFVRRFPSLTMGFFSDECDASQIFIEHSQMAAVNPFSMTASDSNKFFNEIVKYITNE